MCPNSTLPPILLPKGQGPAGLRVVSDLCLQLVPEGCGIVLFLLLVSALVGETGLQACAGFLWEEPVPAHGWVEWLLALWWARLCHGACLKVAVGQEVFRQHIF